MLKGGPPRLLGRLSRRWHGGLGRYSAWQSLYGSLQRSFGPAAVRPYDRFGFGPDKVLFLLARGDRADLVLLAAAARRGVRVVYHVGDATAVGPGAPQTVGAELIAAAGLVAYALSVSNAQAEARLLAGAEALHCPTMVLQDRCQAERQSVRSAWAYGARMYRRTLQLVSRASDGQFSPDEQTAFDRSLDLRGRSLFQVSDTALTLQLDLLRRPDGPQSAVAFRGVTAPTRAMGGRLAVVINLKQDLNLALPVLVACQDRGIAVEAWLSCWVLAKSPRVRSILASGRIDLRLLPDLPVCHEIAAQLFDGVDVVCAPTESNAGDHRFSAQLVRQANQRGLATCTMQHGFENLGLTYSDQENPIHAVRFESQRIYIWGEKSTLHPEILPDTAARCITVGYPKQFVSSRVLPLEKYGTTRPIFGIFENIHWSRYDSDFRQWFVACLNQMAQQCPDVLFLLKPHHAGVWASRTLGAPNGLPANVVLADPLNPTWAPYVAQDLMSHLSAVISTPSTVVLEAASLRLPVAVAAHSLQVDNYQPLPFLREFSDWIAFVRAVKAPDSEPHFVEMSRQFIHRVLLPGDGAARIADDLSAIISERTQRHLSRGAS